jgi:Arc/MetJ-type ribon-helix-helix transcriptional regulator
LSERRRISVQIEQKQLSQIETRIKAEYPKFRNVSEVVRAALKQFLEFE